jgi:hypothetical protein
MKSWSIFFTTDGVTLSFNQSAKASNHSIPLAFFSHQAQINHAAALVQNKFQV